MVKSSLERVGPEARDALDLLRVADDVDRQALAGAGLGDVEARLDVEVGVVDDHARGQRVLAVGSRGQRRHLVAPADPARPGEVDDQVDAARVDVEELAVPRDVVDQRAVQRVQRRVEGLQRAERGQVDAADRAADQTTAQVLDEGFDLGQLGHLMSLGSTFPWRGAGRGVRMAHGTAAHSSHRVGLPRPARRRPLAARHLAPGVAARRALAVARQRVRRHLPARRRRGARPDRAAAPGARRGVRHRARAGGPGRASRRPARPPTSSPATPARTAAATRAAPPAGGWRWVPTCRGRTASPAAGRRAARASGPTATRCPRRS